MNRFVLILLIPISFLSPIVSAVFVSLPTIIPSVSIIESVNFIDFDQVVVAQENTTIGSFVNYWLILTVLYWLGVLLAGIRLLGSIVKLLGERLKAKTIKEAQYTLVFTEASEVFSFFRWIFIPEKRKGDYDKVVLAHELAHIQLMHSLDLILAEVFIGLLWFNPLVYYYRKSLRSIHEFQADEKVLSRDVKISDYLQILLHNIEIKKPNTLYNYFNYPILKRRIEMITRTKSTGVAKFYYLILLPACVLVLLSFAEAPIAVPELSANTELSAFSKLPPSLFPIKGKSKEDITSFFGAERKKLKKGQGRVHGGIDIGASIGTPVIATGDGIITKAKMDGNWGNLIIISHSDGYQTWYAHLDGFNVEAKQEVEKGKVIGYVGNTGLSTAPHLHYEVKLNGERVNPLAYFSN